ncbi:MAG: hypothetical protein V2J26_02690 [Pacificimonas sp.]|jgi:hypothetical protein|nr:hypothetical protein [Pacificimonas sp.]
MSTIEPSAPARAHVRLAPVVAIAAGLATVGAAALAVVQHLTDSTDDSLSQMLSTADGARTALDRIAEAIAQDPKLVGGSQEAATEVARAALDVSKRVTDAAAARGMRVTPADAWGESLTLHHRNALIARSSDGIDYGVAAHVSGSSLKLSINNKDYAWFGVGDIVYYEVGADDCRFFVQSFDDESVTGALRCD